MIQEPQQKQRPLKHLKSLLKAQLLRELHPKLLNKLQELIRKHPYRTGATVILSGLLAIGVFGMYMTGTPHTFHAPRDLYIPKGMTGGEIAYKLESEGIVRSSVAFRILLKTTYADTHVEAGLYRLNPKEQGGDVFTVARVLTSGSARVIEQNVTFYEGISSRGIYNILYNTMGEERMGDVDVDTFDEHIGYLFPDTYRISEETTPYEVIDRMRVRHDEVISELRAAIDASPFTVEEVVIAASLIEREARGIESKRRVSGILYNRLEEGMRLQLDATLYYVLGRASHELTRDDLALDSPYNTYRNEGLPPGPIANPGRASLEAVLDPIPSDDFFYLTGNDGNFYYAETFEEHVANKRRYLR